MNEYYCSWDQKIMSMFVYVKYSGLMWWVLYWNRIASEICGLWWFGKTVKPVVVCVEAVWSMVVCIEAVWSVLVCVKTLKSGGVC